MENQNEELTSKEPKNEKEADKSQKTPLRKSLLALYIFLGVVGVAVIVAVVFLIIDKVNPKTNIKDMSANAAGADSIENMELESGMILDEEFDDEDDEFDEEFDDEDDEDDLDYGEDDFQEEMTILDLDNVKNSFWKFKIGNNSFELPLLFSDFDKLGYTYDSEDPKELMIPAKTSHMEYVYEKEDEDLENCISVIEVYNPLDTEASENDCYLVSITISDDNSLGKDFALESGVGMGAMLGDLVKAFGGASLEEIEDHDGNAYWAYDEYWYNALMVEFVNNQASYYELYYSAGFPDYEYQLVEEDFDGDEEVYYDEDGNEISLDDLEWEEMEDGEDDFEDADDLDDVVEFEGDYEDEVHLTLDE